MTDPEPKVFAAQLEADSWAVETKSLDPGEVIGPDGATVVLAKRAPRQGGAPPSHGQASTRPSRGCSA